MNLSSWNNYISPNAPKPNGPNSPIFMVSHDAPSPSMVRDHASVTLPGVLRK